jgi:hypothetical protein
VSNWELALALERRRLHCHKPPKLHSDRPMYSCARRVGVDLISLFCLQNLDGLLTSQLSMTTKPLFKRSRDRIDAVQSLKLFTLENENPRNGGLLARTAKLAGAELELLSDALWGAFDVLN